MSYVIMCAGEGKRWNNYLGIPKHLVEINGEPLLERTTRLLKENGITNYIITSSDERYKQYGETKEQSHKDCEIDRFEEIESNEICYLYGDVYYTEEAIKTIINNKTENILFFGSEWEIFAIKVKNKKLFFEHKNKVKELYLKEELNRCIGWEIYRSLHNIPFEEHKITEDYIKILDDTDDIDFPEDYEKFKKEKEDYKNFFRIIIPVYDSEYIEDCIKSIEDQTFKDYKIIAVNDQCTDNTFEKVKEMAKKYGNIICLQPTKKLFIGGARNYGLHYEFKTEYTLYMDNDDWFNDKYVLEELHKHIIKNNKPDCIRLPFVCLSESNRNYVPLSESNPKDLVNSLFIAPWTKCIKSNLVIDFPENTMIEDVVQHIAQIDNIETVSVFDKPVNVWNRNNKKSASLKENQATLLNGKRISSIYRNIADLMDLVCKHDYCEEHRKWRINCYKNLVREGKEETF